MTDRLTEENLDAVQSVIEAWANEVEGSLDGLAALEGVVRAYLDAALRGVEVRDGVSAAALVADDLIATRREAQTRIGRRLDDTGRVSVKTRIVGMGARWND